MITVKQERLTPALAEELLPFFVEHYIEIAHDKTVKLSPDWEQYYKLDAASVLQVFIARDEEGTLLGYVVYFVTQNLHYKELRQAVQDLFFVDKTKRGYMVGIKLLKISEEILRNIGVQSIQQHVKLAHDFSPLLERQGYEQVEKLFIKRID